MFRNPVYEKEIRSTYRSVRILAIIVIFNIILALVGISRLSYIVNDMHFNGSAEYSAMLQLYIMIATIEFLLLVLIIPGQTAAAISGERERRTLDAMLSTNITPAALILGKLMASLTTTFLFITSSLPVLSLVFIYGGIQVSDLALLLGYMLFSAIYIGSSSICFSSYFRHTTTSTIISYGFVLFLFIGTLFLNEFPTLFSETVTPTFQTSLSPASYCLILNPCDYFLLYYESSGVEIQIYYWNCSITLNCMIPTLIIGTLDSIQHWNSVSYYIVIFIFCNTAFKKQFLFWKILRFLFY